MSQVLDSRFQELTTQLSECTLYVSKDRTFGDAEYAWVDNSLNIIAEAYVSSQIADFWTCPSGYWNLIDTQGPSWQPSSNWDSSLQLKYSGDIVRQLISLYLKQKVSYNDAR